VQCVVVCLTSTLSLCGVLQCVAIQHVACCGVLQYSMLQCISDIEVGIVQCVAVSAVCVWHPSSRCAVCCSVLQCVSDFRVGIVQAVGIPTMAASGIRYETEVILTFYIPLCDVSPSCV